MHHLMGRLYLILLLGVAACHSATEKEQSDKKEWAVPLQKGLGTLVITLPKTYDTLLTWIRYSDCGDPCADYKYRIQPKNLPIHKENGFFYETPTDSVQQFTIEHDKLAHPWPINDTALVRQLRATLKGELVEGGKVNTLIDTLIQVNGQRFGVFGVEAFDKDTGTEAQVLHAVTVIQGNVIKLFFEKRNKSQKAMENFIAHSMEALKSIRLKNGA